jgi:hypothetical protein
MGQLLCEVAFSPAHAVMVQMRGEETPTQARQVKASARHPRLEDPLAHSSA